MNLFNLPGPVGGLIISLCILTAGCVFGVGHELGREIYHRVRMWMRDLAYERDLKAGRMQPFFVTEYLPDDIEEEDNPSEGEGYEEEFGTQPLYEERELTCEEVAELERIMYEGQ